MSRRRRKLSLAFIGFLLTLLTIVSFAEPPEAPNQLITENPYKEVKTVEANKNREHAEMNISVNKLNLNYLEACKLSETQYIVELPLEEVLKQDEVYYVSKNIKELPDIHSINGKKKIANLEKLKNDVIETPDFKYKLIKNSLLIDTNLIDENNFIISKLNKTSGEVNKVWQIKINEKNHQTQRSGQFGYSGLKTLEIRPLDTLDYELQIGYTYRTNYYVPRDGMTKSEEGDCSHRYPYWGILFEKNGETLESSYTEYNFYNSGKNYSIRKKLYGGKSLNDIVLVGEIKGNQIWSGEKGSSNGRLVQGDARTDIGRYKGISTGAYWPASKVSGRDTIGYGIAIKVGIKLTRDEVNHIIKEGLYNLTNRTGINVVAKIHGHHTSNAADGQYPNHLDSRTMDLVSIGNIGNGNSKLLIKRNQSLVLDDLKLVYNNKNAIYRIKNNNVYLGNESENGNSDSSSYTNGNNLIYNYVSSLNGIEISTSGFKKEMSDSSKSTFLYEDSGIKYRIIFDKNDESEYKLEILRWNYETHNKTISIVYKESGSEIFKDTLSINIKKADIKKGNVNINLSNPLVSGTIGHPLGRVRVYSNSTSSTVPLMGYLDTSDTVITSGIKNNQYKLGTVSGTYIPVEPSKLGGTKVDVTINTGGSDFKKIEDIHLENSTTFNGIMSTVYNGGANGIEVGVDYQQSDRSKYGTDISLTSWDLEKKDIRVTMKHPLIENTFNISVPAFDGEVYYNKAIAQIGSTEVDYASKTLKGSFERDSTGEIKLKFNVGTKDYDLRILGTDNGQTNLNLKIPKQVMLEVTDALGNKQIVPFTTETIASMNIKEDTDNYYIYAPNDGSVFNSEINGIVTLKSMLKNNISILSINGTGINLISVGAKAKSGVDKRATIIDNVNLKLELANFNESIDVTNKKTNEVVSSTQNFAGLLQDSNKLVLKEGNLVLFESTVRDLKTVGQDILNGSLNIKYNETLNRFEFKKLNEITFYNKNLKMEVKTSTNNLLYTIDLQVINTKILRNAWNKSHRYSKVVKIYENDGVILRFGEYARSNRTYSNDVYDVEDEGLHSALTLSSSSYVNNSNATYEFNKGSKFENKMLFIRQADYYFGFITPDGLKSNDIRGELIKLTPNISHEDIYSGSGFKGRGFGGYLQIKLSIPEYNLIFKNNETQMLIKNQLNGNIKLGQEDGPIRTEKLMDSGFSFPINFNFLTEAIDMRTMNLGSEIKSANLYDVIGDASDIKIYQETTLVLQAKGSELKVSPKLIEGSGIKVQLDPATNQLVFTKDKYIDYEAVLRAEISRENGILDGIVDISLKNKVGFEILPGRGVLDFGHFMPGDFKRAESLIEFKNPEGLKISVELNPTNKNIMTKSKAAITPNTTIPLSNLKIKNLEAGMNKTNSFKITGEARTTKETVTGDYRGELDVIITILP